MTGYVRLTFRPANAKRNRTVWARKLSDRSYMRVTAEGDETDPMELIIVAPVDVITEKPARLSNMYATLEVVR